MNAVPAVGEIFARVFNPHKAEYEFHQWLLKAKAGGKFLNGPLGDEILTNFNYQQGQIQTLAPEADRVRRQFGYESHRVQCWIDGVAMVADPRGVLVAAYSLPGFTEVVSVEEPRFRLVDAA